MAVEHSNVFFCNFQTSLEHYKCDATPPQNVRIWTLKRAKRTTAALGQGTSHAAALLREWHHSHTFSPAQRLHQSVRLHHSENAQ